MLIATAEIGGNIQDPETLGFQQCLEGHRTQMLMGSISVGHRGFTYQPSEARTGLSVP